MASPSPWVRPDRTYDERALIEAYVNTQRRDFVHADFGTYYAGLLAHLECLFGIRIDSPNLEHTQKVFRMLFASTVRSLNQVTTPWDTFLETGLLDRKLKECGEPGKVVERASVAIAEAAMGE